MPTEDTLSRPLVESLDRVRAALSAVVDHNQHRRFVALTREHGDPLTGLPPSVAHTYIRETANRCAGQERALLTQLAQLIDNTVTVVEHVQTGGLRLAAATDGLTATAAAVGRLAQHIGADRSQLSVLRNTVRDRQNDPLWPVPGTQEAGRDS